MQTSRLQVEYGFMKKIKDSVFYIAVIGGFSILIYWIAITGGKLETGREIVRPAEKSSTWQSFLQSLTHNLQHPLALLLAQIIAIILVAKLFGWIFTKIRQPTVIGEMVAGIVLGPSVVGMYFQPFSEALFPVQSLGNLQFLSQIGLILFMFIIGMELDLKLLKKKTHEAVVVSHASIVIPFALGMGLAYFIYTTYAPANVQFLSFALFMGIAMSITAFPVLARIIQERGITKTKLGAIAITCAAADDITAWCILAAVIAIVKAGSFLSSVYTILLALAYVLLMLRLVKPFLARIGAIHSSKAALTKPIVAIFFLTLIISAYATEVIGIHALFGAFMAGVIMPENMKFRTLFIEKVEDVSIVLLLPLFFVFTGLRTEIGLLNDPELWKLTGIIILIAVTGKFVGSALAARFVGQNWKDSLSLGALMNTRGLMELVVLNIGYDLKVLTPEVFSMMVIMALVTTFMTGPALDVINWAFRSKTLKMAEDIPDVSKYRILFSFAKPESGKGLLKLADSLTHESSEDVTLTALHLAPLDELQHFNTDEYEKECFKPVVEESIALDREIITMFKASVDIDNEITHVANKGQYDLLLIGLGESIYEGTLLGKLLGFTTSIINPEKLINTVTGKENIFESWPIDDQTRQILAKSHVPVGIFINKSFSKAQRVFIPIFDEDDIFLVKYARRLIRNVSATVIILDIGEHVKFDAKMKESIRAIEQTTPNHITIYGKKTIDKNFLAEQDLMIVSMESWRKLVDNKSLWLSDVPSALIVSESQQLQ